MAETGIPLDIWANIAVAGGTLVLAVVTGFLAYFTYCHMRSSDRQLEMLMRSTEKPMVLELILGILNTIYSDLNRENEIIDEKDILWLGEDVPNNLDLVPLVFPISSNKDFYTDIPQKASPQFIASNPDIQQRINTINFQLEKRRQLYEDMADTMGEIEEIIEKSGLNRIIEVLFSKDIPIQRRARIGGDPFELYQDENNYIGLVTQKKLEEITISMLISSLFKPLRVDEFRVECLGYSQLTQEFLPDIEEILKGLPNQEIAPYIKRIETLLDVLKETNQSILADIIALRNVLKDRYYLTESEMKFHGVFV